MNSPNRPLLAASVLAAAFTTLLAADPARAASSFDACTQFIPSLPAVISTQGVWCMDKDLSTAIASGNAITINTNNVTIDCNGFKLGGLLAGAGTLTNGIYANGRTNITVRDCNIRGFFTGAKLEGAGGSGHRIERNRFEGSTATGIAVAGDGVLIRNNLVIDTGGTEVIGISWFSGISVSGRISVIDNQIDGVDGTNSDSNQALGIAALSSDGSVIQRNRIGALFHSGVGQNIGIGFIGAGVVDVRDNTFSGGPGPSVFCGSPKQVLHGNALLMGIPLGSCTDGDANYGLPEVP